MVGKHVGRTSNASVGDMNKGMLSRRSNVLCTNWVHADSTSLEGPNGHAGPRAHEEQRVSTTLIPVTQISPTSSHVWTCAPWNVMHRVARYQQRPSEMPTEPLAVRKKSLNSPAGSCIWHDKFSAVTFRPRLRITTSPIGILFLEIFKTTYKCTMRRGEFDDKPDNEYDL